MSIKLKFTWLYDTQILILYNILLWSEWCDPTDALNVIDLREKEEKSVEDDLKS
jgi:hypothetical protein